jgi:hypothetical protein
MKGKEKARAKRLLDNYKLTLEEWNKIAAYQQYVCWGCGEVEPVSGRNLSTDHRHRDGLVRGHLCSRCNPVLGKLENAFRRYGLGNVSGLTVESWMVRIAGYVNDPPATKALGREHFGYPGHVGTKKHRKLLKKLKKSMP